MATTLKADEGGVRGPVATVFVADTSAEALGLAAALRAAGHSVFDVAPSMLVARVAVQPPRVILVDADTEGALEAVERMRELANGDDIDVLYIVRPGGAIATAEEALAREGSGLFVRPLDVEALVERVQFLTASGPSVRHALEWMPTTPVPDPHTIGPPPSLPPASMRSSIPAGGRDSKSAPPPSPRASRVPSDPPSGQGSGPARRFLSLAPPVSPELSRLLADAEQRVSVNAEDESMVPSPEEEIEAVLPADLLAALDEPIDEDEADDEPIAPPRPPSSSAPSRDRTSVASGSRGSKAPTTAVGMAATGGARTGPLPRSIETPSTPAPGHTQGGTHSGPTGDGISTTGGSDAREPAGAATRSAEGSMPPSAWGPTGSTTGSQSRDSFLPPRAQAQRSSPPSPLGAGDAMRVIAQAIAARTTGLLSVVADEDDSSAASAHRGQPFAERKIVLREGDVVTTSSTAEDESLLAFLGVRGDLPRETVRRLSSKFPAFGRHAGAALVARGYLRQDQMWPALRAHAEWLFARALQTLSGRMATQAEPSGRLGGEPGVFGGSTGASVFVEVVRRIVSPAEAVERLGGLGAHIGEGREIGLLAECGLEAADVALVRAAPGRTIRRVLDGAPEGDLATVLFAVSQLGVLDIQRSAGEGVLGGDDSGASDVAALDAEAVRERVRARFQLVEDGDYFALLGVPRDATGYEVRRAFLELRRAFDPSRLLTPEVSDLVAEVRTIALVLEEAYEILKDAARRERYRRAIEAVPDR